MYGSTIPEAEKAKVNLHLAQAVEAYPGSHLDHPAGQDPQGGLKSIERHIDLEIITTDLQFQLIEGTR